MSSAEVMSSLVAILRDCALQMFGDEDLGAGSVAWLNEAPIEKDPSVVATIGYGGDIRGAITLHARRSAVASLVPRSHRSMVEGNDLALADYLGELANQLLGRFKHRLLGHNVALISAIPTSSIGTEVRLGPSCYGASVRENGVLWEEGSVFIRLEVSLPADFLLEEHSEVGDSISEGEVILF